MRGWCWLLIVAISGHFATDVHGCPPGCVCTAIKRGKKTVCGSELAQITSVDQVQRIPFDTVQLVLSDNSIALIKQGAFSDLSDLEKLDLRGNEIHYIEAGAFDGLAKLLKLDLSNNRLDSINSSIFTGLPKLEKLYLSGNRLQTIPEGTFNNLPALKRVEFKSDFLRCDCHLQWIIKWKSGANVRISKDTTCQVPSALLDTPLGKVSKAELNCDRPLELNLFELTPSSNQVVFEGDKLPFKCRASVIDINTRMDWVRRGQTVEMNRTAGIYVHQSLSPDQTVLTQDLVLESLQQRHTGIWQCHVNTPQGNVTKSVNIIVVSNSAIYCPKVQNKTNKGIYIWSRTVGGVTAKQPCHVPSKRALAKHECNEEGVWVNLNVEACNFISHQTRKLKEFARKSVNESKVATYAKDFYAQLSVPRAITDPMDIVFASHIIANNLSPFVASTSEISDVILNTVGLIMKMPDSMLAKAQASDKACSRLLYAVESIPRELLPSKKYVSRQSGSIAIEALTVSASHFPGIACFAHTTDEEDNKSFKCSTTINQTAILHPNQKGVHAAIILPKNVFQDSDLKEDSLSMGIYFIMYNKNKLFPVTAESHADPALAGHRWKSVSAIIAASIGSPVSNLSQPVTVKFEVEDMSRRLVPAFWDFEANKGLGDWATEGCSIVEQKDNISVVNCYQLCNFSYFVMLQDLTPGRSVVFFMMEPVIYVGSCICVLCLMAVIVTYVTCYRFILVPKKMKHSVINICISILLLIITFAMGVNRTDHLLACQIVGIAIHYFTLCAVFWVTISASNMLKKFTKAEKPPEPPPPDAMMMPLPPKPIVRFYLLGWGVPIIICGITAAVNINHYAEAEYCFLSWDPSIGAFYGPVSLLVSLNLIFFMRISCVIRGSLGALNETEETEELHVNEIELTSAHHNDAIIETCSNHSDESTVSSVMDQERRPITQLRALVAILFLYIVVWVCGAFAVAQPFRSIIPLQGLIFSYLYGLSSAWFGIFMVCYFCLNRRDSRLSWRRFFCCQPHVYNAPLASANHMTHANGHVRQSASSLESGSLASKTLNTMQTNQLQNGGTKKQSNINLVSTHNASLTEGSVSSAHDSIPNFYNPRQNGAAKKFWDKNRHMKVINHDRNKDTDGSFYSNSDRPDSEHFKRLSQGTSSDANTHFSIEIQIQANPLIKTQNLPFGAPLRFPVNNCSTFTGAPMDRTQIYPFCRTPDRATASPPCSMDSSQNLPHRRTPSSSSLGLRSAFTPILQSQNNAQSQNNTLPRQSRCASSSPTNRYMDHKGSATRTRDFDGQSQTSDSKKTNSFGTDKQLILDESENTAVLSNSALPNYKEAVQSYSRQRLTSGDYSSDGSHFQREAEDFMSELAQRIPQTRSRSVDRLPREKSPKVDPVTSEERVSDAQFPDSDSQLHFRHSRHADSDHNSEPTHKRRHRSHDYHRRQRHRSFPKQRSLDWEEQFRDRPRRIPYAYVNHKYADNVQNKVSTICKKMDKSSKTYWFPRSKSAYESGTGGSYGTLDDSSSSSDESLDNVWVLQDESKSSCKKETSV